MSWLLLALSLAIFCIAWSVHSPVLMVLCLLAALAALGGFAWLRYKLLFPARNIAIDDTPLTAEDVRRLREAQAAASATAAPTPLPAASHPDTEQMRAAAQRVAERDVLVRQLEDAQRRIAEMERRTAEVEPPATRTTPPALPERPQPNLRDEGWNPYAGEVQAPAKRQFDPKAAGLDVPMLTPLRDEPDPS